MTTTIRTAISLLLLAFSAQAQVSTVNPYPTSSRLIPGGIVGPQGPPGVVGNTITASAGADLSLNGGTGAQTAASVTVGDGDNGAITLVPGQPTGGEYVSVLASSLAGSAPTLDPFGTLLRFTLNGPMNGHAAAGWFHMLISSSNSNNFADYIAAAYPYVRFDGSGVASTLTGVHSTVTMNGSGGRADVVDVYNTEFKLASGTNYATAVNLYHAVVPINTSGATKPTNLRGVFVDDLGIDGGLATNTYAIQTLGNSKISLAGPTTVGSLATSGLITSTNTTNSGFVGTGAILTDGGLSVAKAAYIGGILNIGTTGTTCTGNGLQFGNTTDCLFKTGANQFRWNGGGALTLDMDFKVSTNNTYDIGTTGARWRQLFLSGLASVGSLIITASSTPASASATGTAGNIAWDSSYIYVATAANTWKRVAIATW
jgi:hypothetical protein